MNVISYLGIIFGIAIILIFVMLAKVWKDRTNIIFSQFLKNDIIEQMLDSQFIASVKMEDLLIRNELQDQTYNVGENTIQFLLTQRWFLVRFFNLKIFSEHSIIGYLIVFVFYKNQIELISLVDHSIMILTPLLIYGFWGALIFNLCESTYFTLLIIVILNVFAGLNIILFLQYRKQTQSNFNLQKLIHHFAHNMEKLYLWFPNKQLVVKNVNSDFSVKVETPQSLTQRLDAGRQTVQHQKKQIQTIVICFFAVSAIIFMSYISEMQSPWMVYGILIGFACEQLQRVIFCLFLAKFNQITYNFMLSDQLNSEIITYGKAFMDKYSKASLGSPTRQKTQNLDRNSPLKYLIQHLNVTKDHSREDKRFHSNSNKNVIAPAWNEEMLQVTGKLREDRKLNLDNGLSVVKNSSEEPSQIEEMNSQDNLIDASRTKSQRKELSDFLEHEYLQPDEVKHQLSQDKKNESKNILNNILNDANVDIQSVFIKKRLPTVNIMTESQMNNREEIKQISPEVRILPPILVKRNDKVGKKSRKVKENNPPQSPEEMTMISIKYNVLCEQSPLKQMDSTFESLTVKTKNNYRKSIYKTSREEEELCFAHNSKMKISNLNLGVQNELPKIDLISQSKTVDVRSTRSKATRAGSLEVGKQIGSRKKNQIVSVDDYVGKYNQNFQESPLSSKQKSIQPTTQQDIFPPIIQQQKELRQSNLKKSTSQQKLSDKILQIIKIYDNKDNPIKLSHHSKQERQPVDDLIDQL